MQFCMELCFRRPVGICYAKKTVGTINLHICASAFLPHKFGKVSSNKIKSNEIMKRKWLIYGRGMVWV